MRSISFTDAAYLPLSMREMVSCRVVPVGKFLLSQSRGAPVSDDVAGQADGREYSIAGKLPSGVGFRKGRQVLARKRHGLAGGRAKPLVFPSGSSTNRCPETSIRCN